MWTERRVRGHSTRCAQYSRANPRKIMSIKLEYSTTAQCNPESVWQAFTEVEQWPEWSQLFSKASWIEGEPWQLGSKLLLEVSQPTAKVKATVSDVTAPSRATWTGHVMGVTIEHR